MLVKRAATRCAGCAQGRALRADLGPAGVQGRRQVQVLGRPHHREPSAAGPGLVDCADRGRQEERHHRALRRARRRADRRRRRRARACASGTSGKTGSVKTRNVVLAAGGFQANAEWRTRYMGPGWELAKVRGTRFNTGDGIKMALDANAMPTGNWSGGHAVAWDRNAPEFGDLSVGDNFQKHNYPFSLMINANGERFVDEGADFRNYTYAKYGRVILMQPGQFCWQVFDKKVLHLLRDEYRIKRITKVSANTLRGAVREARRRQRGQGAGDHQGLQRGGEARGAVQSQRQGRALHGGAGGAEIQLGRSPSRSRRSRPTPSPAASPSPSAASRSTPARASSTPTARRSPACTRRARWSAASSTSTIRAAPGLTNGAVFGRIAGATAGARARGSNA